VSPGARPEIVRPVLTCILRMLNNIIGDVAAHPAREAKLTDAKETESATAENFMKDTACVDREPVMKLYPTFLGAIQEIGQSPVTDGIL
jgi:hypothetical protein